jgi:hypothetical protein
MPLVAFDPTTDFATTLISRSVELKRRDRGVARSRSGASVRIMPSTACADFNQLWPREHRQGIEIETAGHRD